MGERTELLYAVAKEINRRFVLKQARRGIL
jgi:hypothetical protein